MAAKSKQMLITACIIVLTSWGADAVLLVPVTTLQMHDLESGETLWSVALYVELAGVELTPEVGLLDVYDAPCLEGATYREYDGGDDGRTIRVDLRNGTDSHSLMQVPGADVQTTWDVLWEARGQAWWRREEWARPIYSVAVAPGYSMEDHLAPETEVSLGSDYVFFRVHGQITDRCSADVAGCAVVDQGILILPQYSGELTAFELDSKKERWTVENFLLAPLMYPGSQSAILTVDHWDYPESALSHVRPGGIFTVTESAFQRTSIADGTAIWSRPRTGDPLYTICGTTVLCFGLPEEGAQNLCAIDIDSGKLLYRKEGPGYLVSLSSEEPSQGLLYYRENSLELFDPSNGATKWQTAGNLPMPVHQPDARVHGNTLVLFSEVGLVCYELNSGKLKWESSLVLRDINDRSMSTPYDSQKILTILDGKVFCHGQTAAGESLLAFDVATGKPAARFGISPPYFVARRDDMLFTVTIDTVMWHRHDEDIAESTCRWLGVSP